MKHLTDRELLELIDRSLKQTAEDVRHGRVPLDGRVSFPTRVMSELEMESPKSQPLPGEQD